MNLTGADFDSGLRQERVRLHRATLPGTVASAALVGLLIGAVLLPVAPTAPLLAWMAALAAALTLRLAIGWAQGRDTAAQGERAPRWLRRYRLAMLLHGAVWAIGSHVLAPFLGPEPMEVLLMGLTVLCAGVLALTAFDLVASLLFMAPLLVLVAVDGAGSALGPAELHGAVLMVIVGIAFVVALQAQRTVFEALRLRLAGAQREAQVQQHAARAEAARRQLDDQHQLLTQLLRSTEQGFWFIDPQGVTLDLNPAMCELLGRRREDVLGRPAQDFFSGADQARMQAEIAARPAGQRGHYEIEILRPDGSSRACVNHASPLYDVAGLHRGSVGIWTDLSARREAEAMLSTYAMAVNSIADLVSVVDEHLSYRMVNDAWCRAIGLPREQALGRRPEEVLPGGGNPLRQQALRECLQQQQVRTARSTTRISGLAGRLIETVYYPFAGSTAGSRSVVMVTRDITEQEAARRALEESAEYLRRTLNATGDAIFASDASDPNQPLRFVNEQMLQMWGIPAEAGPRLTPADILSHALPQFAQPEAEMALVARIVESGERHESRVQLRDGRVLLRRCVPARVGEQLTRVWSFRDISAEEQALQQLRASEAEWRALLEAFPGFIAATDQDGICRYVNGPLAQLLGGTPEAFIGRRIGTVTGDAAGAFFEAVAARAGGGERTQREAAFEGLPGRAALHLALTQVEGPLQAGERRTCYSFGIDITARKQAERALMAARDEAERASRAKTDFMSQMSHELRTPMNAILGFGQLLASDAAQALAEHQRAWVREILGGADHLLALINEILDLGRIEAGQLDLDCSAQPLAAVVDECLGLVQALALAHDVVLRPPPSALTGLRAVADRMRLKQVLLNLLGNAIKYHRPGGSVEIECRDEGATVWLGVRDDGKGLGAAELQRLFQPFERLGASRSGIEGTGIGLALSRGLVLAMGGSMGVDSEPGVGSTFWLRLPAAPDPQARADEGAADGGGQEQRPGTAAGAPLSATVLYIEDNPVNVVLMEAMLARLPGLRVLSALLPESGLALAEAERPALILLDIQLPGMDGFEVLARLRRLEALRTTPVIAVSANALQSDVDAAMAAGFDAYLTKPLGLEQLLATVRQVLAGEAPAAPAAG